MKKLCFLIFIFVFFGAHAQETTLYDYHKWNNKESNLSQVGIYNFNVDNNGFIWTVATGLGLNRYDGQKVIAYHDPNYPEINKNRISSFYQDFKNGDIYFLTFPDLNSYSIKNSTIRKLADHEGLFVNDFFFLPSTSPFYKSYIDYLKTKKEDFTNFEIHKCITNSKFMYLLYMDHLVCLNSNGGKTVITSKKIGTRYTCKFGDNILLIGKDIVSINNTHINYNAVKTDNLLTDLLKKVIFPDKDYTLRAQGQDYYLSYKQKLYKISYKNNYLSTEYIFNLPQNTIKKFSYDKHSNFYFFATKSEGIVIVKPKTFNAINPPNKYKFVDYTTVQTEKKWFSYNGWIYDFAANKVQNRSIDNYDGNQRFLLEYKGDYFYQATNQSLVSIIDLKTMLPFKQNNKLKSLTTYTYLNKKLWLANEKYIGFVEKQHIILDTLVTKHLKRGQVINTLQPLRDKLLIGTTKGLFVHKPFSSNFDYYKGLENVNARYIKFLDQSNFWVGCYGEGLFLVYNKKVYPVNNKRGNIKTAHAIEEDKAGNLWISTDNGLVTVNKKTALQSVLNHQPINTYAFTIEDGLPTNEFNGGSTHPSLKTTDGIIGFPSMNGFVWFDPLKVKKHAFSGTIIVDNIISDNIKSVHPIDETYNIDADAKLLKINFSYGYHFNRENLTVSYKFEHQKTWTDIIGNTLQIGRYKKGPQKLLIRITTNGFPVANGVTKTIQLDFEPRFYETSWFWILVSIILLLLILFSYLFGNYYRRIREKNLEKIINQNNIDLRISNETIKKTFAIVSHDLRGPFNSILGFSSYILENFNEITPDELKKYVKAIDSSANKNYQLTLQLLSWSLKQQNGITINKQLYDLNDIVDRSISVLTPLANQKSIEIKTHSELDTRAIGYFDIDIIFNIMYNIISNAIKYSPQNSIITIKSYVDATAIYIETQDAGSGMDSLLLAKLNSKNTPKDFVFVTEDNKYLGGYGLTYAKELVALYDGTLTFKSELNQGTTVIFSFPLENNPTNG